jgi:hypothetical protein
MKDEKITAERLAALEREVETTFRDVCLVLSGANCGQGGWNLSLELRQLHKESVDHARNVRGDSELARLAQIHHDEVKKAVGAIAALRKQAGRCAESFRKKFEKVKDKLDGSALSAAAIKVRGFLSCRHERLSQFVLHLLVTPGLLEASRLKCGTLESEDALSRGASPWNVDRGLDYWPRVVAMLDVVESLGRGLSAGQLQTLMDLDVAEQACEQLIASHSQHYEGKPWQDWPKVRSVAAVQERADQSLARFAQEFLASKAYEDLGPNEAYVRRPCRQHDKAVQQLTISRLEARVEALEARLTGDKPVRKAKVGLDAKKSKRAGKPQSAKRSRR